MPVLRLKRSLHLFALITQLKTTDTPYKTKICRESIIDNYCQLYFIIHVLTSGWNARYLIWLITC